MNPVMSPGHAAMNGGHEPGQRPRLSIAQARQLTGKSESTIKRALRSGTLDGATKDERDTWSIPVEALLSAFGAAKSVTPVMNPGQRRVTPVHEPGQTAPVNPPDTRVSDLQHQVAMLQLELAGARAVADEREKRAATAERALLMLEAQNPRQAPLTPTPAAPALDGLHYPNGMQPPAAPPAAESVAKKRRGWFGRKS